MNKSEFISAVAEKSGLSKVDAKKAIRKAFENSMQGKGSSLVEIVSTCNSGCFL